MNNMSMASPDFFNRSSISCGLEMHNHLILASPAEEGDGKIKQDEPACIYTVDPLTLKVKISKKIFKIEQPLEMRKHNDE
jgi:hypothetical protein